MAHFAKYTHGPAGEILKDGHTMLTEDMVRDLNRKSYLEERQTHEADVRLNNLLCGEYCGWQYEGVQEYWETDCAMEYIILEGSPVDNGMVYCTYCGRKIKTDT